VTVKLGVVDPINVCRETKSLQNVVQPNNHSAIGICVRQEYVKEGYGTLLNSFGGTYVVPVSRIALDFEPLRLKRLRELLLL